MPAPTTDDLDILAARLRAARPWANRASTGEPTRSAIETLAARGPFTRALLIGGEEEDEAERWLQADARPTIDIVDRSVAASGAFARPAHSVRRRGCAFCIRTRTSCACRRASYDAALVAGGISRVINLEYVFDELALALRPVGLLALSCYVGERRQAFGPRGSPW